MQKRLIGKEKNKTIFIDVISAKFRKQFYFLPVFYLITYVAQLRAIAIIVLILNHFRCHKAVKEGLIPFSQCRVNFLPLNLRLEF